MRKPTTEGEVIPFRPKQPRPPLGRFSSFRLGDWVVSAGRVGQIVDYQGVMIERDVFRIRMLDTDEIRTVSHVGLRRARVGLDGTVLAEEAHELWNGKHVVWTNGKYYVTVDDPTRARYVCAWTADNKRIGALRTRSSPVYGTKKYLNVCNVDLDKEHRGNGVGYQMYRALLNCVGPEFEGISSYLPDVANKRQVPAIWRRLGGRTHPESEDVIYVDRPTLLKEGVKLSSAAQQAAYIVAVAEAYDAAPVHDPKAEPFWKILIRHTQLVLFKRLKGSGVQVTFHEDDPYDQYGDAAMKFMLYDIVMNNRLKIYSGFSDNHPTFSAEENTIFRAVHDFFTHGTVRKKFTEGLKKAIQELGLKKWPDLEDAGPLLAKVPLPSHQFTARGEFNATSDHMRLAPAAAAPAIFTEVTGQVCYHNLVKDFPEQKVAILPGFDYRQIGKCRAGSAAEQRMQEVIEAIERGDEEIPLKLKARRSISTAELLHSARN